MPPAARNASGASRPWTGWPPSTWVWPASRPRRRWRKVSAGRSPPGDRRCWSAAWRSSQRWHSRAGALFLASPRSGGRKRPVTDPGGPGRHRQSAAVVLRWTSRSRRRRARPVRAPRALSRRPSRRSSARPLRASRRSRPLSRPAGRRDLPARRHATTHFRGYASTAAYGAAHPGANATAHARANGTTHARTDAAAPSRRPSRRPSCCCSSAWTSPTTTATSSPTGRSIRVAPVPMTTTSPTPSRGYLSRTSASLRAACAAASRATGTRNGEQET